MQFDRLKRRAFITLLGGFGPEGLPIGIQIVGDHFQEALLLRIGAAFEGATSFHKQHPPIYCT
jgi:aspartyl-tRNA(Asn)/glutamyl-tRNA(Gln) amidotransferase subunit A